MAEARDGVLEGWGGSVGGVGVFEVGEFLLELDELRLEVEEDFGIQGAKAAEDGEAGFMADQMC